MDKAEISKIQQHIQELEESEKNKAEFLSMIAHQLKTPLSGIKWTFKMLLDGDLGSFSAEQKNILTQGYKSNERMIMILEEMIQANENGAWDFIYQDELFDIEEMIESLITQFLNEARSRHIHIVYNRPSSPITTYQADPKKMEIVFENLVSNAVKYACKDSEITIQLWQEHDMLYFSIENTGIPIDDSDIENLYTQFYRSPHAKDSDVAGTGLGLFTVKKITDHYGGTIACENNNDATKFTLSVPLTPRA